MIMKRQWRANYINFGELKQSELLTETAARNFLATIPEVAFIEKVEGAFRRKVYKTWAETWRHRIELAGRLSRLIYGETGQTSKNRMGV